MVFVQAEQDIASLQNKLKLMENDLEQAEDQAEEFKRLKNEFETQVDDLLRKNATLQKDVDQLEGRLVCRGYCYHLCIFCVC